MTERTRPAYEWVTALAGLSPRYRWLLEHGRDWAYEERPLPPDVERGEFKNCYSNAGMQAMAPFGEAGRYRYVEGVAWCGSIPTDHAWLVDDDDKVIDPTWVHDGTCGFCLGSGKREVECDCEVDAEDEEWGIDCHMDGDHGEELCFWCGGSGKDRDTARDSSQREYFGVMIEANDLRQHIVATGTWGCLDDPEWYEGRVDG